LLSFPIILFFYNPYLALNLELLELYRRSTPDAEAVWFQAPQTPEEEEQQIKVIQQVIMNQGLTKNF
jgi:hypothetical protein